jgi:hypothetical protein
MRFLISLSPVVTGPAPAAAPAGCSEAGSSTAVPFPETSAPAPAAASTQAAASAAAPRANRPRRPSGQFRAILEGVNTITSLAARAPRGRLVLQVGNGSDASRFRVDWCELTPRNRSARAT